MVKVGEDLDFLGLVGGHEGERGRSQQEEGGVRWGLGGEGQGEEVEAGCRSL